MSVAMFGWITAPMELSGTQRLLLMLPLCLFVAIVYKTIRSERVADIPKAAAQLWVTVLAGMCAVGVGLWVLFRVMV